MNYLVYAVALFIQSGRFIVKLFNDGCKVYMLPTCTKIALDNEYKINRIQIVSRQCLSTHLRS
jgi:hypothetical protein